MKKNHTAKRILALILTLVMVFPGVTAFAGEGDGIVPLMNVADDLSFEFSNVNWSARGGETIDVRFRLTSQEPQTFSDGDLVLYFTITEQETGAMGLPDGFTLATSTSTSGSYTLDKDGEKLKLTLGDFEIKSGSSGAEYLFYIKTPNGVIDDGTKYKIALDSATYQGSTVSGLSGKSMTATVITDQFEWSDVTRTPFITGGTTITSTTKDNLSFYIRYTMSDLIAAATSGQSYTDKIVITDVITINEALNFNSDFITKINSDVELTYVLRPDGFVEKVNVSYIVNNVEKQKSFVSSPLFQITFNQGKLNENLLSIGDNTITAITSSVASGNELGKACPSAADVDSAVVSGGNQSLKAANDLTFDYKYNKAANSGGESARIRKAANSSFVYPGDTIKYQIYDFGNYQTVEIQNYTITDTFDNSKMFPTSISLGAYSYPSGYTGGNVNLTVKLYSGNALIHSYTRALDGDQQKINFIDDVTSPIAVSDLYTVNKIVFEYGDIPAGFKISGSGNTSSLVVSFAVKTLKTSDLAATDAIKIENTAKVSYNLNSQEHTSSVEASTLYYDASHKQPGASNVNKVMDNLTNPNSTQAATGDIVKYTITYKNNTEMTISNLFILEQFQGLEWDPNVPDYREAEVTVKDKDGITLVTKTESSGITITERTGGSHNYLSSYTGIGNSAIYNSNANHLQIQLNASLNPQDEVVFTLVLKVTAGENEPLSNTFESWGSIPGSSNVIFMVANGYNDNSGSGSNISPMLSLTQGIYKDYGTLTKTEVSYDSSYTVDDTVELIKKDDILTVELVLDSSNAWSSAGDVNVVDMVVRFPTAQFEYTDGATQTAEHYIASSPETAPINVQDSETWTSGDYTYVRFVFMDEDSGTDIPTSVTLSKGDKITLTYDVKTIKDAGDSYYLIRNFTAYAYFKERTAGYNWDKDKNGAADRNGSGWIDDKSDGTSGIEKSESLLNVSNNVYLKGGKGLSFGYVRIAQPTTPIYLKDSAASTAMRTHTIYIYNTSKTGDELEIDSIYYQLPIYEEVDVSNISLTYHKHDNGFGAQQDYNYTGLTVMSESNDIVRFGGFKDIDGSAANTIKIARTGETFSPSQSDYVAITFKTKIKDSEYDNALADLQANNGSISSQTVAAVYLKDGEVLNSYNSSSNYVSYSEKDTDSDNNGNWDSNDDTDHRYRSQLRTVYLIDGTAVAPGIKITPMQRSESGAIVSYTPASGSSLYTSQIMGWKVELANDPGVANMVEPTFVVVLPPGMEYVSPMVTGEWLVDGNDNLLHNTANGIEPKITTLSNGQQVLSWKMKNMILGDTQSKQTFIFDAKMIGNYLGSMTAKAYLVPHEFFYGVLSGGYGTATDVDLDAMIEATYGNTLPGVVNTGTVLMSNNYAFSSEVRVTDHTSTAISNSGNTAITLDSHDDLFQYTLTLRNDSWGSNSRDFENIVFIDRLPGQDDISNVYDTPRGSTAGVYFDTVNFAVEYTNDNGLNWHPVSTSDYKIEYTDVNRDVQFSEKDYTYGNNENATWSTTEPTDANGDPTTTAVRISFKNVKLAPGESVRVVFDANFVETQLPARDIIAYNSFGFGFTVDGSGEVNMSEPENVSVSAYQQSVEGYVYVDSNKNGYKDTGEYYYTDGTTVTLASTPDGGTTWNDIRTTTSDANGYYHFGGLDSSTDYKVYFNIPSGYNRVGPYTGEGIGNNAFASDDNIVAYANFITLSSISTADKVFELDAGIYKRSSGKTTYSVIYHANNGLGEANVTDGGYESGDSVTVKSGSIFTAPSGKVFAGWSATSGGSVEYNARDTFTMPARDVNLYAVWEDKTSNGGDDKKPITPDRIKEFEIPDEEVPYAFLDIGNHYAYIVGYPDGNIRPQGNVTREEVATIFFRLLTSEARTENWSSTNSFSDVSSNRWSNNAISTMVNIGIIKGYPDGTFRPGANITRAELAAIAARFDKEATTDIVEFTDISGHWARNYIIRAALKGWVKGYEDGTFRPDQAITRAEVMTLVNNVLDRHVESEEDMLDDMVKWPDNSAGAWYYLQVQEATNSHFSTRKEDSINEKWTEIRVNPDWKSIEKPGASITW